ncbi:MAG: TraR/DksA family transcriptional regulator [Candidatus Nealsonbacteria bacterium DGGOD1a]|nr:MAG: TraR/DksA family transcriptional regulator [Candidatus Nealsonbacteria bacterium DGGOD1a]
MDQKKLEKFKDILTKEKIEITAELNKIATQSKTDPKEWITNFTGNANDTGHESLEIKADEVEEYGSDVAITKRMAQKLADIDLALDKIEKKVFGKCEDCGKDIPIQRLEAFPTARFCTECGK